MWRGVCAKGAPAGDNPWGSSTLEWATTSPPAPYNFARVPVLGGREPLWERNGIAGRVEGLAIDVPETLITRVLDATPDHRSAQPRPTIWPFISAVATSVLFIGSIFTPWAIVWGTIPVAIAMTAWFWPSRNETEEHLELERKPGMPGQRQ